MKLTKHLQTLTNHKDNKNEELKSVLYETDGSLYATDSKRAIRIKNHHDLKERTTVNMETMTPNNKEVRYPNIARVFPTNFNTQIVLDNQELKKLTRIDVNKKNNIATIKIDYTQKQFIIEVSNEIHTLKISRIIENSDNLNETQFYCNITFLADMFKLFKDNSVSDDITFGFVSPVRPFMFINGNIDYLITPIRKS